MAQRASRRADDAAHYPLFDQLGSTVALTDEQRRRAGRYVYEDPFGDNPVIVRHGVDRLPLRGRLPPPRHRLLQVRRALLHAADLGRWTQRDPLNQAFSHGKRTGTSTRRAIRSTWRTPQDVMSTGTMSATI